MVLPRAGIRTARRRLLLVLLRSRPRSVPCARQLTKNGTLAKFTGLICRRHVQVRLPVRTGKAFIGDSATLNPSTSVACSVLNHLSFLGGYTKCKLAALSRRKVVAGCCWKMQRTIESASCSWTSYGVGVMMIQVQPNDRDVVPDFPRRAFRFLLGAFHFTVGECLNDDMIHGGSSSRRAPTRSRRAH
jgi:hypothetical protein